MTLASRSFVGRISTLAASIRSSSGTISSSATRIVSRSEKTRNVTPPVARTDAPMVRQRRWRSDSLAPVPSYLASRAGGRSRISYLKAATTGGVSFSFVPVCSRMSIVGLLIVRKSSKNSEGRPSASPVTAL